MKKCEMMVPFLLEFEAGVPQNRQHGLTPAEAFERARRNGFANDPADSGGATMIGVTIATYRAYCRQNHLPEPIVADLKKIPYTCWLDIFKQMYWNRWQADSITDLGVAMMLVDWLWMSGRHGIIIPQKLLGVTPDGIAGPRTIAAVNSRPSAALLAQLTEARHSFHRSIAPSGSRNSRFLAGWNRRVNALACYKPLQHS